MSRPQQISINNRVPFMLNKFKNENQFNDCVIITGDNQYPCQRVFLAKLSGWFYKYFKANPIERGTVCRVKIPENPGDMFGEFLSFLYEGQCLLTVEKIPPFLKIAVFYEIPSLVNVLKYNYQEANNESTLLYFCREFINLGLLEDAEKLAPFVAKHLRSLLRGSDESAFTIEQIFEALSPKIFAAVLNEEIIKSDPFFSDDTKVGLVDQFVGGQDITDESDRKALATVANWHDPNAYLLIAHHNCEWLPDALYRPLVTKVLDARRGDTDCFTKDIQTAKGSQSRWYAFAWLQDIRDAKQTRQSPKVKVMDFISTLGGSTNAFNPEVYGLITSYSNVEPLSAEFAPRMIFHDFSYFLSMKFGNKMPMLGFSLGPNAHFTVEKLTVDSRVKRRPYVIKAAFKNKPTPKKIKFIGADVFENLEGNNGQSIDMDNGLIENHPLRKKETLSVFGIQLDGSETNGGYALRICDLELEGVFKNQ